MDENLKAFGDFLIENYDDEELTKILKENLNPKTRELIAYVKENLLSETIIQDMMHDLRVKDTNVLTDNKDMLEKKLKDGSFTAEDALRFASDLFSMDTYIHIPNKNKKPELGGLTAKEQKEKIEEYKNKKPIKEKLRNNILAIQKMEEPRRTRTAKLFAFQMMGALNKKLATMTKKGEGQTRTIITKEIVKDNKVVTPSKAITQSMKGKNNSDAVRTEVRRAVRTAANSVSIELEQLNNVMADEEKAKKNCIGIYKEFIATQYDGDKKDEQFISDFRELISREKEITQNASTQQELEITQKQRADWNKINAYLLMKEVRDYAKGYSKLTLDQIKKVVIKLKNSHFESLKIADEFFGGKEEKRKDTGTKTQQRGGQA